MSPGGEREIQGDLAGLELPSVPQGRWADQALGVNAEQRWGLREGVGGLHGQER